MKPKSFCVVFMVSMAFTLSNAVADWDFCYKPEVEACIDLARQDKEDCYSKEMANPDDDLSYYAEDGQRYTNCSYLYEPVFLDCLQDNGQPLEIDGISLKSCI